MCVLKKRHKKQFKLKCKCFKCGSDSFCDLVDFFLSAGEGEGEAKRKNLFLQILKVQEFTKTVRNIIKQLVQEKETLEVGKKPILKFFL